MLDYGNVLFAVALIVLARRTEAGTCYNCGSQILLTEWQATGYPVQPNTTNFFNGDDCFSDPSSTSVTQRDCSSSCVEALYVINGAYAILRGCLSDLLGEYFGRIGQVVNDKCSYGQSDTPATILTQVTGKDSSGKTTSSPKLTTFPKPNNAGWTDVCTGASGTPVIDNPYQITCQQCAQYDGATQKCRPNAKQNKEKCVASWCVKVEGRINGHWTEMRGCAPFNPLAADTCVQVNTTRLVSYLGTAAIAQKYELKQCFWRRG